MADTLTRPEMTALLEAAEARTEARMAQFASTMRDIAVTSDHRFEILTGKIDSLAISVQQTRTESQAALLQARSENQVYLHEIRAENLANLRITKDENQATIKDLKAEIKAVITEVKDENRQTRRTIIGVGFGAVIAVLALVVSLWVAGINEQSNLIAVFQTALSVQTIKKEEAAAPPPAPLKPAATSNQAPPAGK